MNSKIKPTRLRKPRVSHEKVELSSGNVFADLGFQDAEERLLKAKLATKIPSLLPADRLIVGQTHFSFSYSFFASIRIGVSASASFHSAKKS